MPIVRTRLQLKTRARYLADATSDANISDTDLNEALNDVLGQLHGVVAEVDPDRFIAMQTLATTQGTQAYELGEDFMAIRRIDFVDGDQRIPLVEASALLELDFSNNSSGWGGASQYRVMGSGMDGSSSRLYLAPDPGTETYEVWYVTAPPTMTADDDELDVVASWHTFITQGLAAEICERQERPSAEHRAAQAQARVEIVAQARKRDAGRAKRPIDVRWGTSNMRRRVPPWPTT